MPSWVAFLLRRLVTSIVLLLLLTLITFAAFWKIPNEPAAFLVDLRYATPQQIEHARHALGVDRPLYVQYGLYVWRALHGDLGQSFSGSTFTRSSGVFVGSEVLHAAGVTAAIALGGAVLLFLLSLPLGLLGASRPRSPVDRMGAAVSVFGVSIHPLVVAVLVQLLFASTWHWLPQTGYCDFTPQTQPAGAPSCSGPAAWAEHLALPWLTFAVFFIALYSRMIRARMLEVLDQPYIRTARAKGVSERRILLRHALPNTALPLITMLAMDIGTAVGICVYIEAVFRMPGLGFRTLTALEATYGLDLPMLLGIVLFTGAVIIILNLIIDLAALALDPTISRSPRGRHGLFRAASRTTSAV